MMLRSVMHGKSGKPDFPRVSTIQTSDQVQQSTFTRATLAHERQLITLVQRQLSSLQNGMKFITIYIAFA
ncbi:Uncharacterised protein [Vibrio cholerae]|nr:Uncharacterised protein [Vibrio cholerae]